MNAIMTARYNLAIAYLNDSQYSEAIPEFEAITKLDKDFIDAHCGLSRAYLELNELDKAEISAKTAISLNSDYPSALTLIDAIKNAHYDNGIASLNNLSYNDAVSSLRKVEDLDPEHKNVGYNLGRAYIGLKEYDKAINSLQHALSANPELDGIHFNLGHVYVEQRQFDNAIQHLERAIISDPNKIDAHYDMARAYRELGNLEAATNAASETLRLNPNFQPIHDLVESIKQTHYNKGIAYLNDERYSDAVASFHNVIALDSDFTPVNYNLGIAYLKMENYPRAIDVLQKAVKLDTTHKSAYHALALAFFGQHELENARNAAKEALKIDSTFQPARSLLEAIDPSFTPESTSSTIESKSTQKPEIDEVDQQHLEDTVSVQNKDNQSKPKDVEKETQETPNVEKDLLRGSVLLNNKQYNQAAAVFKRVIKANPNSVEAFYGLGQVYFCLAAYEDAVTAAKEALKLNPKHHPSRELLTVIKHVRNYERKKKYRKKIFIYTSIVIIIALGVFTAYRYGVINIPDLFSSSKPDNQVDPPDKPNVNTPIPTKPTPPILSIFPSIEEPSGNGFIDAGETVKLMLNITNTGGIARNVTIRITPTSIQGLQFEIPRNRFEVNKNKPKHYEIPITADQNVKAMPKTLTIQLIGENQKVLTENSFVIKTQPDNDKLKPQIIR